MPYNPKTHGVPLKTSLSYPGDDILTAGFHAYLAEMKSVGLIDYTQAAAAPGAPVANQLWYKPDSGLSSNTGPAGDSQLYRWNGSTWVPMTPTQMATYIMALAGLNALPANAVGFLKNDGTGALSWDPGAITRATLTTASGAITLDGNYDVTDLTLVGNITLQGVTNFQNDKPHLIRMRQDGTGNRTIAINNSVFKLGNIVLNTSTAAGAIDVMGIVARTPTIMEVVLLNSGVQ